MSDRIIRLILLIAHIGISVLFIMDIYPVSTKTYFLVALSGIIFTHVLSDWKVE